MDALVSNKVLPVMIYEKINKVSDSHAGLPEPAVPRTWRIGVILPKELSGAPLLAHPA